MSFLNHLQFQQIDPYTDTDPNHMPDDDDSINLYEPVDDGSVNSYLDRMVKDVGQDPDWCDLNDK